MKKDKEFQPIQIGLSEWEENDHTQRFNAKIKAFKTLSDYLLRFVSIDDKNTLKGNIYEIFLTTFLAKEQANFPPNAPINSILNFFEVNTNKIESLITEFNEIECDITEVDLNEPTIPKHDWGIYTTNQAQNDLFFKINKVVTAVNDLEASGIVVYKSPLVNAFNFTLHYDMTNQKLAPNINYVLGNMR